MTSKYELLTEAPTTIIRVEDLIAKKDAEYPEDPARDVCNGAQDPVMTTAGNSGRVQIRELCDSTDKLGSANTTAHIKCRKRDSLDQYIESIENEKRLERHARENKDRE